MATGTELILGFAGKKAIEEAGFVVNWEEGTVTPNFDFERAHINCINRANFTFLERAYDNLHYLICDTPLGKREFAKFECDLFYDPNEMEENEDQAVVGVAISGRYYPTFVDWKDPSGTLYPVVFDVETLNLMNIARTEIEQIAPVFKNACFIVKEIHY